MTNEELINGIRRDIQSQNANFTIMAQGMNEIRDAVRKLTLAKEQGPKMILLEESKVREAVEECITDSFIARNLNVTTHASAEIGPGTREHLSYTAARLEVALDAQSDAIKKQTITYENARRPLFDRKGFRWIAGMMLAIMAFMCAERVFCPDVWCHRAYDAAKALGMDAGATYVDVREAFNRDEKGKARSKTRALEKQNRLRRRYLVILSRYLANVIPAGITVTDVQSDGRDEFLIYFYPNTSPNERLIALITGKDIAFSLQRDTKSFDTLPSSKDSCWGWKGKVNSPYEIREK